MPACVIMADPGDPLFNGTHFNQGGPGEGWGLSGLNGDGSKRGKCEPGDVNEWPKTGSGTDTYDLTPDQQHVYQNVSNDNGTNVTDDVFFGGPPFPTVIPASTYYPWWKGISKYTQNAWCVKYNKPAALPKAYSVLNMALQATIPISLDLYWSDYVPYPSGASTAYVSRHGLGPAGHLHLDTSLSVPMQFTLGPAAPQPEDTNHPSTTGGEVVYFDVYAWAAAAAIISSGAFNIFDFAEIYGYEFRGSGSNPYTRFWKFTCTASPANFHCTTDWFEFTDQCPDHHAPPGPPSPGPGPGNGAIRGCDVLHWPPRGYYIADAGNSLFVNRSWHSDQSIDSGGVVDGNMDTDEPRLSHPASGSPLSIIYRRTTKDKITGKEKPSAIYRAESYDYAATWIPDPEKDKPFLQGANGVKHAGEIWNDRTGERCNFYNDGSDLDTHGMPTGKGKLKVDVYGPDSDPNTGKLVFVATYQVSADMDKCDDASFGVEYIRVPNNVIDCVFTVDSFRKIRRSYDDGRTWVDQH